MIPHNSDNQHGKLGNTLIRFCGFGMAATSVVKFLHPTGPVAYLAYLGYEQEKLFVIAGLEMLAAILFLLPSTRSAGLLLVSSYFGGAIAAHLAAHPFTGGGPFLAFNAHHHYLGTLPATLFLLSAWIGSWLHHPESRWSSRAAKSEPAVSPHLRMSLSRVTPSEA